MNYIFTYMPAYIGEEVEAVDISGDKRKSVAMDVEKNQDRGGGAEPKRIKRRYVFKKHADSSASTQPALKKHGRRQKFPPSDTNNSGEWIQGIFQGNHNNGKKNRRADNSDNENGSNTIQKHGICIYIYIFIYIYIYIKVNYPRVLQGVRVISTLVGQ
jgi:hypothetical protein